MAAVVKERMDVVLVVMWLGGISIGWIPNEKGRQNTQEEEYLSWESYDETPRAKFVKKTQIFIQVHVSNTLKLLVVVWNREWWSPVSVYMKSWLSRVCFIVFSIEKANCFKTTRGAISPFLVCLYGNQTGHHFGESLGIAVSWKAVTSRQNQSFAIVKVLYSDGSIDPLIAFCFAIFLSVRVIWFWAIDCVICH